MSMRHKIIIAVGVALAPTLAIAGSVDNGSNQTILVQGGQGGAFILQIPAPDSQAPYALTGTNLAQPTHTVSRTYGQGMPVEVRLPD